MVRHRRTSRRDTVHREVWGVQDRSKRKDATKGKASAKTQGEGGGTLRDIRGDMGSDRNRNVFARPNGLREIAETVMSCSGSGPARRKKEVYQYVVGRRENEMHWYAIVAKQ